MDLRSTYFILPSFFFVLFCIIGSSNADSNTITQITQGQKLKDGQRLVSPNLLFSLEFFIRVSSTSRYLGILLKTSSVVYPIWVVNRDSPIEDSNGILSLEANGILRVQHNGESIVVLNPNQAAPNSNVTATLLDSGNLVLTESNSNSSGVYEGLLWQSFDYPTHTLLLGMKLGFMKSKTGQKTRSVLTSWLNDRIPSSGDFTLGVDPNSNQLLIQQRRQNYFRSGVGDEWETYWRSGDWDGRNFRLLPNLTATDGYLLLKNNIKFSFNSNERYFSFDYSGSSRNANLDLPILVWVLNPNGKLESYEITRDGAIASDLVLVKCKADNGIKSDGCEKLKLPECRTGEEQFERRRGTMEREGPPPQGVVNNTDGLSDCEANCRSNCSCIAYASFDRDDQTGCQFWFSGSRFVENTGPQGFDIYLLSSSHGKKLKWWLWIIIVGSLVSAMVLLGSLSYFWWKSGKREENEENLLLEFGAISSSEEHGKGSDFQLFTYDSIVSATDNFSTTNKLGEGGFGPVYKGKLNEGQEIAVKKLSKSSGQGLKEFKNEIVLIAKLQHMNLVRLLGCSIKGEEKMLIYEYMPNNSLDSFLFDPAGREQLDWGKRINIIEGIAQGLLYLHKYSRLRVIHRDLKASNILLDAEMNPKISDFGMAKIFGRNDSKANTNRIVGTYGYMSPEYAMEGIFSVKSDVFSFGVLLLEIVSSRRNASFNHFDHHINLIGYAWDLWQKNSGMELMDPMLATSCSEESFLRCVHVGLLCVQESAADRPTMLEVVSMLTNETMTLAAPRQPAFSTARSLLVEEENSKAKSENCSQNELTISVMEAR